MRPVVLPCAAGILIGLAVILMPLAIIQPTPFTRFSTSIQQGDQLGARDSNSSNATTTNSPDTKFSPAEDSKKTPAGETSYSERQFWLNRPLETFGLASFSLVAALSVFIASRRIVCR